jgi:hypothetical protein
MDVREKLVELMADHCDMKDKRCIGCEKGLQEAVECKDSRFGKVADHLIDHGVTVQEWISVKDRLPEDFAHVLICSVIGNQHVAQHLRGHFYSDGINIGTSHWMPLPDAPKGE